jgi:hypothetical protein
LKATPSTLERLFHLQGTETKILTIDSKSLTVFFRDQGIYLFIAFVVGATFWAIGQPINPFTVILYSLCIGNFVSPPMQWLHALYENLHMTG